ncbi:MAG: hypothetical protein R3E66_03595 [bacterium]
MLQPVCLLIMQADSPLGAEVARFGVAMSYEVIGVVDAIPELTDPWMFGVTWIRPGGRGCGGAAPRPFGRTLRVMRGCRGFSAGDRVYPLH